MADPVRIERAPPPGLVVLRLRADDGPAREAAAAALGATLPEGPRHPVIAAGMTLFWTSPNAFLLTTPDAPALAQRLSAALAGHRAAFLDVTHSRAVFRIAGLAARDLLAKGTGIDLHPRAFRSGEAALTRFAGLTVLLHQEDATPSFALYGERAAEHHFWTWLQDSVREFA